MHRDTWRQLLTTASRPGQHSLEHRMLFLQWLQLPVWEQVRQIRQYVDQAGAPTTFDRQEWTHVIPPGEPWVSAELFLDDLAWIFCLLVTPPLAGTPAECERQ